MLVNKNIGQSSWSK